MAQELTPPILGKILSFDEDGEFLSAPTAPSPPPPPPPPPPPVEFNGLSLLADAPSPLHFRVIRDLLSLSPLPAGADAMWMGHREGIRLATSQRVDGLWNNLILAVPKPGSRDPSAQVGTVSAVHRLLELGWEVGAPPFAAARRPLFRLLAEDVDHAFTYEFAGAGRDPDTVAFTRGILRGGAASALAHLGFEMDPRLRGAATRLLERVDEYISSPLVDDPWIKQGGEHALHPDAFPPSMHFVLMLSYMPVFLNEHDDFLDRLAAYLARPVPKHAPRQWVGARPLENPYLLLGDPLGMRGTVDADVPFAAVWLEVVSRAGLLPRHPAWMQVWERLLDERDRDLVWKPSRSHVLVSHQPFAWPFVDLSGRGEAGAAQEIAWRLAMAAHHLERGPEFA